MIYNLKKIKAALSVILAVAVIAAAAGCTAHSGSENAVTQESTTQNIGEVIISDEVESLAEDTSNAVEQGEDIATD